MHIRHLASTALSLILIASATPAMAAGFYIQEQSVKGLGNAFSGSTTSIDDASTIYFNPAGMTELDGAQANVGVHLLLPNADITDNGSTAPGGGPIVGNDNGNPYDPSPVPNLYIATPLSVGEHEIWTGIGVSAPFGLASDYGEDSFLRFDSTETELTTINVAPSVAYKINDMVSVGGGLDIQYADAELKSAIFAGANGTSTLEGDDITLGYNLGVTIKPAPTTELGLHYRSAISHELDGKVIVEGSGAADRNDDGTANLDLPDILTFGAAHDVNDKLRVMGQATWFGWSRFEDIDADVDTGVDPAPIVQDYQNTMAFAVGAEYDLRPDLTVRVGYQFDETPTTDEFRTSRTPDGDRHWFSGGATYKLNNKIELDFAATYIDIADGTIDVTRNGAPLPPAQVTADTDGYVGIVAAGLNYKF
jgi:long-chain fatty acid transport protein